MSLLLLMADALRGNVHDEFTLLNLSQSAFQQASELRSSEE